MRVVIDTNVVVSALLKVNGPEAGVLFAVSDKKLIWCVSPAILAEYATVLHRPKFSHISESYIHALLTLAAGARVVHPTTRLKVSSHEEDNRFYECAQAAHAEYIVTGYAKHFPQDLPPTKVVNAGRLLQIVEMGN